MLGRGCPVRRDHALDRGLQRLVVIAPVPDQAEPPLRAQHARELAQRRRVGEPVERLAGDDAVDLGRAERQASAWPARTSAAGAVRSNTARMPATGSTAITRSPRASSGRVSLPVPAPISSTRAPGASPSRATSQSTAAAG